MKERTIAAGCAAAILSGGLCCLGIFSVRAAEQKKQETAETESDSMQTELSEDGSQLKIFDLSLPVPEGMDFQVFDEDGIEIATAVAGDLRIFLSAGETEAVEGSLGELSEEEQKAYQELVNQTIVPYESWIEELGDFTYLVNLYSSQEPSGTSLVLSTVSDGICYSIAGYVNDRVLTEEEAQLLTTLAVMLKEG